MFIKCILFINIYLFVYASPWVVALAENCQKQQPFSRLLQQVKLVSPFSRWLLFVTFFKVKGATFFKVKVATFFKASRGQGLANGTFSSTSSLWT